MIKIIETIERTPVPAWRKDETYKHVVVNINEGADSIERTITPAQFKGLLAEGGWFKGTRKWLGSDWPYMFRVREE